jgi:outer membrane protein
MLRFRVLSAFAVCVAALASTSFAEAQAKIAVVNFQKALVETAEAKKAQADLVAKFKPQSDQYEKANRDYSDLQTLLQNSQGKLSAAKEVELQSEIQHKQREVERMKQDLDEDVQKERDETVQRLGTRMTEVVGKLMEDKGLDVIIDSSAVVKFKSSIDLTADATAAYDKAYPVK